MKNLITPLLMATALIATACTNTNDIITPDVDPSGKTPISFVGENSNAPITCAGFSDNTQIAMHIRSVNKKETTKIKETRILAKASADATMSSVSFSNIDGANTDYIRYWDDAYGRDAKLSIFAVAVPGTMSPTNGTENKSLVDLLSGDATWKENANLTETIKWAVSTDQSGATTIANEDLAYSNNIKENGTNSVYEWDFNAESPNYKSTTIGGEMQFQLKKSGDTDGPGKFNKGHLVFNHALSRITVHLIKGDGFVGENSFNFATGTNVTIKGVHTTGTLNIENGSWALPTTTPTGISKMATTTKASGATHSLVAQMMPGFVINKDNDTNVLEFTIDGNAYYVTQDMMFNALEGKDGTTTVSNTITMEQGKNYVFNITVKKTQISNITASLQPWADVKADNQTLDNSKDNTITFYKKGTENKTFDLYRLCVSSASSETTWGGNYTDRAEITDGNGLITSNWFFDNDNSYYHFRSVSHGRTINEAGTDTDDYFDITSGSDFFWGAPIKSSITSNTIKYNKDNGYTDAINPAIGATTQAINLTEFNVMSKINVILRTTKTDNKVVLDNGTDKCDVELTYFYASGQVKMGNGLVSTTGNLTSTASFEKPTTAAHNDANAANYTVTDEYTYSVVPQSLVRSATLTPGHLYVGITITTVDGNKYYITEKLSDIMPSDIGGSQNQTSTGKITEWFPNHSYTYYFTLTKTGITNVTCSVQPWVDVTATNQNISLED